ncbi:GIY-YIG nuclease family protein [Halobacillus salinus]|uniref:GIY-YIG nuclease family protein n=1 Tax=Halobacillus salinus TaxID=192814 RepID=UPI0009A5BBEA|nr:GIY-YIG nuclease family protein [Halobacillus salinus]
MADEHYVYMLRCKDNTFYTGYTNDLENRLKMHESGKGAKYTRGRGPFVIELVQTFETKREAMQTEYRIKRLSRTQKERYVKEQGGF